MVKKIVAFVMTLVIMLANSNLNNAVIFAEGNDKIVTVYFGRYVQEQVTDESELEILSKTKFEDGLATVQDIQYATKDGKYFKESAIEWRIIEDDANYYTLISEKVLDQRSIGDFWSVSSIRSWLNDDFLNRAFSESEQEDIIVSEVTNLESNYENNPGGGKPYDVVTNDKVYLLSQYDFLDDTLGFLEQSSRIAYATEYVNISESETRYWLRGPKAWSYGLKRGYYVDANGSIGTWYPTYSYGIRPVIRVNKNAEGLSNEKPEDKYINIDDAEVEKFKFGTDVEFTVPNSIPVLGGGKISLDFSTIPVLFEKEENTYRIGIGIKNINKMSDDDWFNYKKFIETQNDDLKKGINSFLASKYGIASMGMKVKPQINCYGYVEGTINDEGIQSTGGKVIIEMKVKANQEWQTTIVVVPVVIKASGEVGAKIEASLGVDFTNASVYTKGDIELTLPKVRLSAGVGVAYIADVSVYGSFANKISLSTENLADYRIKGTIEGEAGISAKVLFAEYEKSLISGSYEYYDSNQKSITTYARTNNIVVNEENYTINRTVKSTEEDEQKISTYSVLDNNIDTEVSNVYTEAKPQIVETNNGKKILVYTEDIQERNMGNHTAIVYSIYDEQLKMWSEAQIIDNDGTADFYPDVAVYGENIYVAWSDSNKIFTDEEVKTEDFLTQMASSCDISMATINMDTKQVINQKITNNSMMELNASVVVNDEIAYVSWIENENNDVLEWSGNNNIYVWNNTNNSINLYQNINNPILSSDIGILNDTVYIAYTLDEDKELSTANDSTLYVGNINSEPAKLIESIVCTNPKFIKYSGENSLMWYTFDENSGSSLRYTSDANEVLDLTIEDKGITPDFSYIEGEGNDLLIYSNEKKDENGSDICAYIVQDGEISEPIAITDCKGYANNATGLYEDGEYILAFTRTDVTINTDMEDVINETTDLCVTRLKPQKQLNIENIAMNKEQIIPGESVNVIAIIKNDGLIDDSNYVIQVWYNDELMFEQQIAESIHVGETKNVSIDIPVPNDFGVEESLTFKVLASDGTITEESELSETIAYTDLQLEAEELANDISLKIRNLSAFDGNVKMLIRESDYNGTVLATYNIGIVEAGKDQVKNISKSEFNKFKSDTNSFYVELVVDEKELYTSNNYCYLYIENQSDEVITTKPTENSTIKPTDKPTKEDYDSDYEKWKQKEQAKIVRKLKKAKIKIKKLKNIKRKKVKLSWKVNNKWYYDGYQIVYARNKKFTKGKKVKKARWASESRIIKGLKKKKTYYFKIRAYKMNTITNKKVYGPWSKVKKIKIRK